MKLQMTRKLRFSAVLFAAAFCLFFSGCEYLDSFLNELNGQEENKTEEQKDNNEENGTDDNGNSDNNGGNSDDNGGNTNSEIESTVISAPYIKTNSNWTSGKRSINISTKKSGNGIVFKSTVKPNAKPDYSRIDNIAKNLEINSDSMTIEEAAKKIVADTGASTDKEKARALFTWIASHIEYAYGSNDPAKFTPDYAYKNRNAVCGGFSYLMQRMCTAVNVKCDFISGSGAKGFYETPNLQRKSNFFAPEDHAWNLIHADTGDFLLDVTWAAGKTVDYEWFDVDPCYFITSHFPAPMLQFHYTQEGMQLLSPAITRDEFITMPRIDPCLEEYGVDGKEIFEFVATHLDSWIPTYGEVDVMEVSFETELYEFPMNGILDWDENNTWIYKYKDKVYKYELPAKSTTLGADLPRLDFGNIFFSYKVKADIEDYGRDKPAEWFKKVNTENALKVKPGVTASIDDDGVITINGYKIPKTGFTWVVPQNEYVTIDGNLPLPPEMPDNGAGVHEYLVADSAFPQGRKVRLSSYEMSNYPVTVELFTKVLECFEGFDEYAKFCNYRQYIKCTKEDSMPTFWYEEGGYWVSAAKYDAEFIICDYIPTYSSEKEYLEDYPLSLGKLGAWLFCDMLTELLLGEENCIYGITNLEFLTYDKGIEVSEDKVKEICSELGIEQDQILHIYEYQEKETPDTNLANEHWHPKILFYCEPDYTKKGFRAPFDAEWEYAARGADPKASVWFEEHTMTRPYGEKNSIGLYDLFAKNPKRPAATRVAPYYVIPNFEGEIGGERIDEWLTSSHEYDYYASQNLLLGYVDDEGYIWNPHVYDGSCDSYRLGTSDRIMGEKGDFMPYNNTRLRLARSQ